LTEIFHLWLLDSWNDRLMSKSRTLWRDQHNATSMVLHSCDWSLDKLARFESASLCLFLGFVDLTKSELSKDQPLSPPQELRGP
jgi:ABC-type transporter Mla MlaB component